MFDAYSEPFNIIVVINDIKLMHNILPIDHSFPFSNHKYIDFIVRGKKMIYQYWKVVHYFDLL